MFVGRHSEIKKMALSPFNDAKFKLPSSSGEGFFLKLFFLFLFLLEFVPFTLLTLPFPVDVTIRNLPAVNALKTAFIKTKNLFIRGKIISLVQKLFHANPINYYVVEEMYIISTFIDALDALSTELQVQVLRMLRNVVSGLSYIPFRELVSLSVKCQGSSLLFSVYLYVSSYVLFPFLWSFSR